MYRLALLLSASLAATTYGAALPQLSRDEHATIVRSAFYALRDGPGRIVTLQACNDYEVIIGGLRFCTPLRSFATAPTNLRLAR
jgi:hypothetical protein